MFRNPRFSDGFKLSVALGLGLSCTASAATLQPVQGQQSEARAPEAASAARPRIDEAAGQRRLEAALRALAPQRPGVVDAYVVAIALDSDPVFGREASVAGEVLQRRYDARGRTVVLAAGAPEALPPGTPASLSAALARISDLMDEDEDVLVLYSTSHGSPLGLAHRENGQVLGVLTPKQLRALLDRGAVRNRLLILSACYSGIFLAGLHSENSVIVAAAARDRTSFGCLAENDWTFFGDAMINHALRKPQSLGAAFAEATALVAAWESRFEVTPSRPQIALGGSASSWLRALERRMPASATPPVGRPAVETSRTAFARQ